MLRITRTGQTTSVASTQQDVSGLALGWGDHARNFVNRRPCSDWYACRVLTRLSAPAPTAPTSSNARFCHALIGKIKEEKAFTKGN